MGKGGDPTAAASAATKRRPKEVLIDGTMYDVTTFRHPGGSVINFLSDGGDASDAFKEFHGHSAKVRKYLQSLPQRKATEEELASRREQRQQELTESYQVMRKRLVEAGFFKPSFLHIVYRLAEIVLMHALGFYLLLSDSRLASAAGLLMLGIVQGRCGWLMHEAGHYSFTKMPALERVLQAFLFGVGDGMSAGWWRSQHNRHHAAPQKLKHDVDLQTMPLVSFNHQISARVRSPLQTAWLRMQGLLFFPVTCTLVALGWQFFLHPRYMLRQKKVFEFACIAFRYVATFGWLLKDFSWGSAIGLYVLYVAVGGSYIFTNFALSHTHLDVTQPDDYIHWAEYAVHHTTNIAPHPITTWWMSYLNFQIEHHLFPQMPQYHMPRVAPIVRAWCKENSLPYDERGYWACCKDTFMNLHNVGSTAGADARKK